jgi:hypothetical protein
MAAISARLRMPVGARFDALRIRARASSRVSSSSEVPTSDESEAQGASDEKRVLMIHP